MNNDKIDKSNAFVNAILTNNKISNPNYNPKTKKGRLEQPFIDNPNPIDIEENFGNAYRKSISPITYTNKDLGLSTKEIDKYHKYNAVVSPYTTEEERNRIRAENQSALEQTGNSIMQAVVNEVAIGTVKSVSDIIDNIYNLFTDGTNDYTNPFSSLMESWQDSIREKFEIYQKDPKEHFAFGDFGWWANNFVSVATTASLMLPSTGAVKLLGLAAKGLKLYKASRGLAKVLAGTKNVISGSKGLNTLKTAEQAGAKTKFLKGFSEQYGRIESAINDGLKIGTTALISRMAENYQEAREVYKDVHESAMKELDALYTKGNEKELEKFLNNNPEFVGKSKEEIADIIAYKSGHETYVNDFAMLLMDIPQFKAISSLWKGVASKETNAALRIANRNAARELYNKKIIGTGKEALKLEKDGFLYRQLDNIKYGITHPLKSIQAMELSEGIEEGYQGAMSEVGKEVAAKIFDPNYKTKTLNDYLTDPEIYEQAFWGVLGGIAFQKIGTGLGNAYRKGEAAFHHKILNDKEWTLQDKSDQKARLDEINSRSKTFDEYQDIMYYLNQNEDPNKFEYDENGNTVMEDGQPKHKAINEEEARLAKLHVTNTYLSKMVVNAVDNGNYDLLKEFLTSKEVKEAFANSGIQIDGVTQNVEQYLLDKMDDIHEKYTTAISDVFNNAPVKYVSAGMATARNILNKRLKQQALGEEIDNVKEQISSDNEEINNLYKEQQYLQYAKDALKQFENATVFADIDNNGKVTKRYTNEEAYQAKLISKQAYEQNKKDIENKKKEVFQFLAEHTTYGAIEEIKTILEKTGIDNASVIELNGLFQNLYENVGTQFAKVIEGNNETEKSITPKVELISLLKKQIDYEFNKQIVDNSIPSGKDGYIKEYKEIEFQSVKHAREKFDKAIDRINKYIEKEVNTAIDNNTIKRKNSNGEDISVVEEVRNNIMTNNVPDYLKNDLDIVKIGYGTTNEFAGAIYSMLKIKEDDIAKAEQEKQTVTVNGERANPAETQRIQEETRQLIADENETVPSMGEEQQTESTITSEEENALNEQLNRAENEVKQQEDEIDDLYANEDPIQNQIAYGTGISIIMSLCGENPSLIKNPNIADIQSAEYQQLKEEVINRLIAKDVNSEIAKAIADKVIIGAYRQMGNILSQNAERKSVGESFINIADQLANKVSIEIEDNDGILSIRTNDIDNSNIEYFVDKFISYPIVLPTCRLKI